MTRTVLTQLGLAVLLSTGCATASAPTSSPSVHRAAPIPGQTEFDTAESLAARGDFVRAEQYFVSALRNGYPAGAVIVKLLRVCLGSSRPRAALGYAQLYLLDHPDAYALRHLVATLHAALGQPEAARREAERVLETLPAHAASLRLLAQLQPHTAAPRSAHEVP